VQHVVDAGAGVVAVVEVADIAFDKGEIGPLLGANEGFDLVEVFLVPGGEVVQPDDLLVEFKQGFQQVGADKACYAGDQPGGGLGC